MASSSASALPTGRTYLVGGGIASLSAAAFMIRDAGIPGPSITILEGLDVLGGSLDGAGDPHDGYMLRGGRMMERKYRCTFDLFSSIPSLDDRWTVTDEILRWNEQLTTSSSSRLVRNGRAQTSLLFGLSEWQIVTLERLLIEPEILLGRASIADEFDETFFKTDFWLMWCTTFAFQPWHSVVEFKRYLGRFAHMVAGFERLEGILRTPYNQYDSLVRPLQTWLAAQGVDFVPSTLVTDLRCAAADGKQAVTSILTLCHGVPSEIGIARGDRVIATLGSMTEQSSFGTMDAAPDLRWREPGASWALWHTIAKDRPEFGHPWRFCNHVDQSKWTSFTITLHDPAFLNLLQSLTGNVPGQGGLVTIPESNWLLSIVVPHQPHFIGQPADVSVCWGYGLSVDQPGNFVHKPMSDCSGREIMTELLGHLRLANEAPAIIAAAICIPCMMPYVTSQFLPREDGDRPAVIPPGWGNLAFIGQFCELPDDVVFTVEYSIRSAWAAVFGLFGKGSAPPPVYKSAFEARVLYRAFMALHDVRTAPAPA